MLQQIQQAFAVLPDTPPEPPAPDRIGIKAFDVFVVKVIEFFFGFDSARNKNKIQAVHQPPVFREDSFLMDC